MSARVTATWGPFKFSPVRFETLDVGPFSATVDVRPGESEEDALVRAYEACERAARKVYPQALASFLELSRQARDAARG
jgi:hypothetical protein